MAKGGINLNPGADSKLVSVAYAAAMANVPKDLSGTFEAMAENYAETMKSVGESWAGVAKTIGEAGGQLAGKAIKEIRDVHANMGNLYEKEIEVEMESEDDYKIAKGDKTDFMDYETWKKETQKTKTVTQTMSLGQDLRNIRKELFSLFLKTDKESSARKIELRRQKDKWYSNIAILEQENEANNQLLTNENVNLNATGSLNLALNLAIKDYRTKSGKIKEGPYAGYSAVLSKDEEGDLTWMLKDPNGKFVTGMDGDQNLLTTGDEPYRVPLSEMSKTLTPKMDQTVIDDANKIFENAFNQGKTGADYLGNQLVSKFRPLLENETSLHQLADVRLGDSETTLREQFNSESVYSAEIFAGISSAELKSMGVVDADNDNDVDKDDVFPKGGTANNANAIANFKAVRGAIFDKNNDNYNGGKHLRSVTEKHIYNTGELMHGVGEKASGTTPAWKAAGYSNIGEYEAYLRGLRNPGKAVIKDYENIKFGNQSFKGPTATKVLEDISTGTVTDPRDGSTYTWNNDGWYDKDNKNVAKDNDTLVKDVLQLMDPRFYGIANPTGGGDGDMTVTDNTKKKYGWGEGTQSIAPEDLLKTLTQKYFSYYNKSYPTKIKTKEDLIALADSIDKGEADLGRHIPDGISYQDGAEGFIEMINKELKTNIDAKYLSQMIRDLVENMGGKYD